MCKFDMCKCDTMLTDTRCQIKTMKMPIVLILLLLVKIKQ